MQVLLEHGADANRLMEGEHTTPLHIAAERGFTTVVRELLDCGADVDGRLAGACTVAMAATPLIVAVNNARVDCVSELLRAGADQNIVDARGQAPVQLAVLNDDVVCVRLLLDQTPSGIVDDLLALAIVSGASCEVTEALIRSGRCHVDDVGSLCPCRPLMLAALKGRSDVMDTLLDCNAEVDADLIDEPDRLRLTALQFAVSAAVNPHYRADYCRRYACVRGHRFSLL